MLFAVRIVVRRTDWSDAMRERRWERKYETTISASYGHVRTNALAIHYPSTRPVSMFVAGGGSSVGRAPGLQPGGRGFESHPLHVAG
jgi:hypothetical protein